MPIANHSTGGRSAAKLPRVGTRSWFRHAGYEDARQGFGFRREYDGWSDIDQRNYERGRWQAALVHRALGGTERDMLQSRAPKWPRTQHLKSAVRGKLSDAAARDIWRETSALAFDNPTRADAKPA